MREGDSEGTVFCYSVNPVREYPTQIDNSISLVPFARKQWIMYLISKIMSDLNLLSVLLNASKWNRARSENRYNDTCTVHIVDGDVGDGEVLTQVHLPPGMFVSGVHTVCVGLPRIAKDRGSPAVDRHTRRSSRSFERVGWYVSGAHAGWFAVRHIFCTNTRNMTWEGKRSMTMISFISLFLVLRILYSHSQLYTHSWLVQWIT